MATGLVDIMKRAALEASDNAKLADLRFGTVISESPLKVEITNQFVLPESVLIVPEHLTDHEIEISIYTDYKWLTKDTENGGSLSNDVEDHKHDIEINPVSEPTKKKNIKLWNGLRVGDKVALLRKHGGQSYFILDRLPKE